MGWGTKAASGPKPFGIDLAMYTSTGADAANGGLPEGAIYFAGVFYQMIVEVMLDGVEPVGGWEANGLVPPLRVLMKTPFSGKELDNVLLAPVAGGVSGVAGPAGFGAAAGSAVAAEAKPISGSLAAHVLWVGPNGWQACFRGAGNSRLEKVPVKAEPKAGT